jgi:hypothetical protein
MTGHAPGRGGDVDAAIDVIARLRILIEKAATLEPQGKQRLHRRHRPRRIGAN